MKPKRGDWRSSAPRVSESTAWTSSPRGGRTPPTGCLVASTVLRACHRGRWSKLLSTRVRTRWMPHGPPVARPIRFEVASSHQSSASEKGNVRAKTSVDLGISAGRLHARNRMWSAAPRDASHRESGTGRAHGNARAAPRPLQRPESPAANRAPAVSDLKRLRVRRPCGAALARTRCSPCRFGDRLATNARNGQRGRGMLIGNDVSRSQGRAILGSRASHGARMVGGFPSHSSADSPGFHAERS